jgi:hypothetical protein
MANPGWAMNDLVEHIRTVHFTVLIVVLAMTAALQIDKKGPLERAATDAEIILHMTERWEETRAAITNDLDKQAEHDPPGALAPSGAIVLPKGRNYQFGIISDQVGLIPDQSVSIWMIDPWIYFEGDKDLNATGYFGEWKTLKDFLRFWDGQKDGTGMFFPSILAPGTSSQHGPYCTLSPSKSAKPIPVSGGLEPLELYSAIMLHYRIFRSKDSTWWTVQPFLARLGSEKVICDFSPVEVSPVKPDLARVFRSLNPQAAKWGNRDSASEFSELITFSKHLEDTPLANLAAALRDRANTDTERIELFQAKLSPSAIPTFGSIVLLLCQLYLLAHLRALSGLVKVNTTSEWPSGYIGLYNDWLAAIITFVSLTVFPLAPFLFMFFQHPGWLRYLSTVAGAISLFLGLGCFWVLLSIRKLHKQPPPSPTWSSL